ncbi:MAG: hypothetical protein Q4A41_01770 [Bacillota bacterium]|nr:hypothetical protein [Bacillota bacterium]
MKKQKMADLIFLCLLVCIGVLTLLGTHFLKTGGISKRENRTLNPFPALSADALLSGTFQDDFEHALMDRILLSGTMKKTFNLYRRSSHFVAYSLLRTFHTEPREDGASEISEQQGDLAPGTVPPRKKNYIPRGENLFEIEDSGHLVLFGYQPHEDESIRVHLADLERNVREMMSTSILPRFYLYYIEGVNDVDFLNHKVPHTLYRQISEAFRNIGSSASLKLESVEDYQAYYYKTDHHLNHVGRRKTYVDVIRLLLGEDEPLLPHTPVEIGGIRFVGSRGRMIDDFSEGDVFVVNSYPLPELNIFLSGVAEEDQGRYGRVEQYLEGKADADVEINHYGICFGQDTGLIQVQTFRPEKQNLLLIADSYSNPLNLPIASHFNQTYIVDLRHYLRDTGREFSLSGFTAEHEIDKVLILGSAGLLRTDNFRMEPQKNETNGEVNP